MAYVIQLPSLVNVKGLDTGAENYEAIVTTHVVERP